MIIINRLVVLLVLFAISSCADMPLRDPGSTRPFRRVMLFNGAGFKTAMFLGMYKAAKDNDLAPDAIIAGCGGAVAAGIVNQIADSEKQLEFVKGYEFYKFLKSIEMTEYSSLGKTVKLAAGYNIKNRFANKVPNIFDKYLMHIPDQIGMPIFQHSIGDGEVPILIVGGKALFNKSEVGAPIDKKLFKEVYFTGQEMAVLLEGFLSPIAQQFPQSSVMSETAAILDVSLEDAIRSSISDMFYVNPKKIGEDYYITGAIDLHPIELASFLAEEIMMLYTPKFDPILEEGAMQAAFHYSYNQRLKSIQREEQGVDYWIDYTDFPSKFSLQPSVRLSKLAVTSGMPDDYQEFRNIVHAQYWYGYNRTIEAIKNQGSLKHIRNKNW